MQRIMVDLPEPEGPQTTTRSFSATDMEMSRSTCSEPNHLFTLFMTMIGGAAVPAAGVTTWSVNAVWLIVVSSVQRIGRAEPVLQSYWDMTKQNAIWRSQASLMAWR